jgi:hypothetical protein
VDGHEHRRLGDAAFGGGRVDLGGDAGAGGFRLGYGDLTALAGDYFAIEDVPAAAGTLAGDNLFTLARVPGDAGTKVNTRDEIVCALKVMSIDEAYADERFEPGGEFAHVEFSPFAASSDVERRVRDRYLERAATNDDHFVAPGGVTHESRPEPFGSAPLAYRHFHELALQEACRLGRTGGDLSEAMAREAAAQHFLSDAFTSGHLRTPVAQIRRFWHARYPAFWQNLQGWVADRTAATLSERSWALRRLPGSFVHDATAEALQRRTSDYPELSLGDFLARLFHDWDNVHGLAIEGGAVVFGDGHVHEGDTGELVLRAARAGIDDVEAAFALGVAGSRLSGAALYGAVRAATGARGDAYVPETRIPRLDASNLPQNWRGPDIETLWNSPMLGTGGVTVGEALVEMLQPGGQFIRQLDSLGQGLVDPHGLLAVPFLGGWLTRKGAEAYHHGFVEPLAADPERTILGVVHNPAGSARRGRDGRIRKHT